MGIFSSLAVFSLVRVLVLLVIGLLLAEVPPAWLSGSAIIVVAVVVLITMIGLINARRVARVVSIDMPIRNLPDGLKDFTIVQISDIHVGPTIKYGYIQKIVERVNGLSPDLIAITGDLVDGTVEQLSTHTAPLGQLKARYGTYVVTGNHEYYSGALAWIAEFKRIGLTVLLNEHVRIAHGKAELVLGGITDYSAGMYVPMHRSDPAAAIAGAPPLTPKILLAHQPRSARAAEEAGFDAQLSGHTHGGQFWPWMHFVRLQQPWVAGMHQLGQMNIYISRGTGYWGPPIRFGAPSEITRIRLVKAAE
ncbi:metallophosphoesterase [Pseudomonas duriflava]|nr:metallophosphoesterase [Pseudomonas duriflava]